MIVLILVLACLHAAGGSLAADLSHPDAGRAERLSHFRFDDPSFFPIGVWLQQPSEAHRYKAAGINLYIGLWQGPTAVQLEALKRAGMPVIARQNEVGLQHPDRDIIVGWHLLSEPDNGQPRNPRWLTKWLGHGPPVAPQEIETAYRGLLANDPKRPILLGLGQGVAWDGWHGRGRRSNHPEDYPAYVRASDIVSFNIYPVGHPHPEVAGRLEYVARGVERLRGWTRDDQRVWAAIGATGIHVSRGNPTPAQVRSQTWMSLIHGAHGIMYFAHLFGGPKLIEAALLEDPPMLEAVTRLNRQIRELAPVLNSPTLADLIDVTSDPPGQIATMAKRYRGALYVFAVAVVDADINARFRVRGGDVARRVRVIGEDRSIALDSAVFADHFGPYAVHLYRFE